MQIIRPYGTSRSKRGQDGLRRVLVEKTAGRAERDIPTFARTHDELVIAQWISTIDKIARKPTSRKKPSADQRAFREKLGNACWVRLMDSGRLKGPDNTRQAYLSDLWWFKIHPYEPGIDEPRPRPNGSMPPAPKVEGRWYKVFAGDVAPQTASAEKIAEIAKRIERHLYENEYRLGPDARPRQLGKIESRAESISAGVLRIADGPRVAEPEWSKEDEQAYIETGDPVVAIRLEAESVELKKGRATLPLAAEILFKHWAKVFVDPDTGMPMGYVAAKAKHSGMVALHMKLKECYRRLLKRTRKDTPEQRKQDQTERRLSKLLPRNLAEALNLSAKQDTNAELGHLVRLGKVIHYTASGGEADFASAISRDWPVNVETSRFWSSEGQAQIKRAEAFVRIWRHALVLAGLTLKDWVSTKGPFAGDILGGAGQLADALKPELFDQGPFNRKLQLLFGNRSNAFVFADNAQRLDLLSGLISGTANLRHAAFHFKGRGQLLHALAELPSKFSNPLQEAARKLWSGDVAHRADRLKATLRGAHIEHFATREQAEQVLGLLAEETRAELPLPRLSRVLLRAENAWGRDHTIKLPEPANRRALEAPSRQSQYTLLKLIYERPFRSWLRDRRAGALSQWIDRAIARATKAAKTINAKGDEVARRMITAKAEKLPKPTSGSDMVDFFFDLSAATASEMRVQRGYESDREQAREQADHIDQLLCDVVTLAFSEYLSEQRLDWIVSLKADQPLTGEPAFSLDGLQTGEAPVEDGVDWQIALYLLLHLLPVEAVAKLLHQLFKWDITAGREGRLPADESQRLHRLFVAMTLYLDMHDAKYEGGNPLADYADVQELFETAQGFGRVFPKDVSPEADRRLPKRGLREILRFGHLPLVKAIAGERRIEDAMIDRVFTYETSPDGRATRIAALQLRREELHERWVRQKHLEERDLREYCETVAKVSEHRQESNFTNLVDHVRAHHTILAVLGRLVDYVGLFERDLYFSTLALISLHGERPETVFGERGLRLLRNGQVIFALRTLRDDSAKVSAIKEQLAGHFTEVWAEQNAAKDIRNDLAHLNMLQGARPFPNLTYWTNQIRQLMGYDRKLKNAVSKSVIDMIEREGIELRWVMRAEGSSHDLADATLGARKAKHLGGKHLTLVGGAKLPLEENLHGLAFAEMIATSFEGKAKAVVSIGEQLSKVDWRTSAQRGPRRDFGQDRSQRPFSGGKTFRPSSARNEPGKR
jgi:hypothetical protein